MVAINRYLTKSLPPGRLLLSILLLLFSGSVQLLPGSPAGRLKKKKKKKL